MKNEFDKMTDFLVLEEFDKLGKRISFHYADDSGKEWRIARSLKPKVYELYRAHPELQEEMNGLAKGWLWTSEYTRDISKLMQMENDSLYL